MGASYRLLPPGGSESFYSIMRGRKRVGRVAHMGDYSGWLGIINRAEGGREEFMAPSPEAAFEGVVARRLGFGSAAELHERNRSVRRANSAKRAEVRDAINRIAGGDFSALERLLDSEDR